MSEHLLSSCDDHHDPYMLPAAVWTGRMPAQEGRTGHIEICDGNVVRLREVGGARAG
ncbi:hypothetical protein [Sphingosinicella sp. CPCC 101087]|uniref:hypothetical protein n=1 Tax=Sphingosinicella sp. CPCC 101087 TaxID=2497754 RepID=UPI0013EA892E|nr:hypothetical protein [Sphingosinicella sp. CPCC 101087]